MRIHRISILPLLLAAAPLAAQDLPAEAPDDADAASWDHDRPDAGAPSLLTSWRLLEPDELRFSLTASQHAYDGMRDGRDDQSTEDVLALRDSYTFSPTEQTTQLVTLEALYGLDENWTLFARLPFRSQSMDIDLEGGGTDELESSGISDIVLGAVTHVESAAGKTLRANLGVQIPTGSVDEEEDGEGLPYRLQNGTGTFDILPGATYMQQLESWSWGAQLQGRIHLGRNSEEYAVSDGILFGLWLARPLNTRVSGYLRLAHNAWGDYNGRSDAIDASLSPVNDKFFQGGARTDLFAGVDWHLGDNYDQVHTIGFEVGVPVDEWLDGPQLSTDMLVNIGYHARF